MVSLNGKIGDSSPLRLERIVRLMSGPPFSVDRFLAFSRDHENGPGANSLCRQCLAGEKPVRVTVSAMVVRLEPQKSPEVWIRLGRPCEGAFEKISF